MEFFAGFIFLIFAVSVHTAASEEVYGHSPRYVAWMDKWIKAMEKIKSDPILKADLENRIIEHDDEEWINDLPEFKCNITKPGSATRVPTSVHELHPSDIKVIGAYGDSITAGNGLGAEWLPEVVFENRGEVWSGGAEYDYVNDRVLTLPNLLKIFNPDLKGGAVCSSSYWVRGVPKTAWLNLAEPGSVCYSLLGQSLKFIREMKNDPRIDYENDWKMLTLFIGGNDLCAVCREWNLYRPEMHSWVIQKALDILYNDRMPRTIVNLVTMFDISPLTNMSTGPICDYMHEDFCRCAVNESTTAWLKDIQFQYWNLTNEIVSSGRYDGRDDFTVVMQPHMRDMKPPIDPETGDIDFTFLGPDCFHPGRKGHYGFAFMLWNMLFTPVPHKPFKIDLNAPGQEFACPSEEYPYIFTNINSEGIEEWPPASKKEATFDQKKDKQENSALPKQ